ncbi:MAG: hypothetical protein QOH05_4279 [Acetobacteraceae bacterium]|jgi:hypothetical protein|nr:hypothetical protein [Acetobacteraceae bacterium]
MDTHGHPAAPEFVGMSALSRVSSQRRVSVSPGIPQPETAAWAAFQPAGIPVALETNPTIVSHGSRGRIFGFATTGIVAADRVPRRVRGVAPSGAAQAGESSNMPRVRGASGSHEDG